ncbi:hypothetical protein P9112_006801 [Eukaryota sp. TZLM1-RC]
MEGQVLVARQTLSGDSLKVDSYLSAFPKLFSSSRSDYNFIDSVDVRYVFHSMEKLFIVLLTSLSSNILDDNEALTLISRCIKSTIHNPDPNAVRKNAVLLLHLLDECVGSGHRELASPTEIENRLSMYSAEEEAQEKHRQETVNKQKEYVKKQSEEALQRRLVYLSSGGDIKKEFEIDGGISSESRKSMKSTVSPTLPVAVSSTGGVSRETKREATPEPVMTKEEEAKERPSKPRMTLKAKKKETLL